MIAIIIGATSVFNQVIGYLFVILLPNLALYIIYLFITKAFHDMGFSSLEAIVIVFVSFLLGLGIIDGYIGINFYKIPLFICHTYCIVGINVGGVVIPIILSIYLSLKNRLKPITVFFGIGIISVVTFFVTYPDPKKKKELSQRFLFEFYLSSSQALFLFYSPGERKRRLHRWPIP